MGLERVEFMGTVSLGRTAALLAVMTASLKGGAFAGSAAGTAFGLAMDAGAGTAGLYTMAYAFPALCSGAFSRFGRLPFLAVFDCAGALTVLAAAWGGEVLPPLFESFAASVIFMLIPSGALAQAGALFQPLMPGMGESGLRKYASRRVAGIAGAYLDVCAAARRGVEEANDNDTARVFDRAADAACARCAKKGECWVTGYMETLDAMNGATAAMKERGRLESGDLPEWFSRKCVNLNAFVTAVNAELRAQLYRAQYRERLREGRAAAWGQYEDFAEILSRVSAELGSINGADPLAERRLLRYLRSMDIEADCAVFRDATGRLRAVIESGSLPAMTRDPAWLDRLSAVLGVRLCTPSDNPAGRVTLLEAEPLCASVGIAALKKPGEKVSGDRGTYFKTDSGTLCVILSDGMGAGEDAAGESGEAVRILERFLRSGVDPAAAMKVLNSVMLLKSGDDWGCATADLMCVDLFTGEADFYKYGAAPSYIHTAAGGAPHRLHKPGRGHERGRGGGARHGKHDPQAGERGRNRLRRRGFRSGRRLAAPPALRKTRRGHEDAGPAGAPGRSREGGGLGRYDRPRRARGRAGVRGASGPPRRREGHGAARGHSAVPARRAVRAGHIHSQAG